MSTTYALQLSGEPPGTFEHDTLEDAHAEAERLIRKHGKPVMIHAVTRLPHAVLEPQYAPTRVLYKDEFEKAVRIVLRDRQAPDFSAGARNLIDNPEAPVPDNPVGAWDQSSNNHPAGLTVVDPRTLQDQTRHSPFKPAQSGLTAAGPYTSHNSATCPNCKPHHNPEDDHAPAEFREYNDRD